MPDLDSQYDNITEPITSNSRIAKNTMMLYFRMIVMILLGLYTSRVVLHVLGVDDFGLYYAVGGVVAMFYIVSSSLSTAISRYLTFELGRGNKERLRAIFSTSLIVQFMIAIGVVFVIGAVGLWLIYFQMKIPDGRESAAIWVLFCCITSFAVGLISTPYTASIISHEKMGVFAYMSLLEAALKLGVAFAISASPFDRLKTYSTLLLSVSILLRYIYTVYCRRHFSECKYKFLYEPSLLKEMAKFAGWSFVGNAAWILNTQGVNILINVFFGVTLSAARGVANQVEGLVTQFVANFMTALNPQITKSYASGNFENMYQLVCRGAKFSFFLALFFAIPCGIETEKILSIWLGVVPDYAVIFVRLTFATALISILGNTLVTAQLATGKIKKYQIIMTICGIWVFPLTWLAFRLGANATWAYIIYGIIYFLLVFVRIYLVKDLIQMPLKLFLREVIALCVVVLFASILPPLLIYYFLPSSVIRLIIVVLTSFISSGLVIYWIGLHTDERQSVKRLILEKALHR